VPEQLLAMFGGGPTAGANAQDMVQRLNELAQKQQEAMGTQQPIAVTVQPDGSITVGPPATTAEASVPCPFCDEPMSKDEIVCRHCGHYVNQASAHGETEHMAPGPQLYSEDRNLRFDALWRLVFADDAESLAVACEAVPHWDQADRLLAVHMFAEVADPRPVAFVDFMAGDADPAVQALARDTSGRLRAPADAPE
jgi:hypothetical protein